MCLYVCDQETPKREAKGQFWTISACEWMNEWKLSTRNFYARPWSICKGNSVRLDSLVSLLMLLHYWSRSMEWSFLQWHDTHMESGVTVLEHRDTNIIISYKTRKALNMSSSRISSLPFEYRLYNYWVAVCVYACTYCIRKYSQNTHKVV
jgi:hypothetical protein